MTDRTSLPPVTLVLGGARSGKSRYAEQLVEGRPGDCIYLATAEARDVEMAHRIEVHRARRGKRWATVEAPLDLVKALNAHCRPGAAVLVDCLSLWLSNQIGEGRDPLRESEALVSALPTLGGPVVFVSNEVGLGIVPDNELARHFRDHAGYLHRAVAAAAQSVALVVAGLPLKLKPAEETIP
ncbi:MAG TPA: bifunctional adenosylcobinamide kinase/adenosylcobinamide-phosphate guanylyltransferase [Alphaproteobacteria bacterium]|nr:bifunctional adenosylcobinamide kinase/adenosylcobinamide-phosphate guanylyltransferase [Alphaproteobacteria bacterium]